MEARGRRRAVAYVVGLRLTKLCFTKRKSGCGKRQADRGHAPYRERASSQPATDSGRQGTPAAGAIASEQWAMTINERWRISQWRPVPRHRPPLHMIGPERERPHVTNSSQHAARLRRGLRTMPKPSLSSCQRRLFVVGAVRYPHPGSAPHRQSAPCWSCQGSPAARRQQ